MTVGFLLLLAMPGAAQAADSVVTIEGQVFMPQDLTTGVGSTVTWINNGVVAHDAVELYGAWRTPRLMPGEQASVTFDTPGAYSYLCSIHPGMRATVTVAAAAPDTDTASASPAKDSGDLLPSSIALTAGMIALVVAARRLRRPAVS